MASAKKANSSVEAEDEWHRAETHEVYAGDYDDDDYDPEEWRVSHPPFFVAVKNAMLISMTAALAFHAGMYLVIYLVAKFGER